MIDGWGDDLWLLGLIVGSSPLIALAASTSMLAVYCTIAALLGKFPIRAAAIFWMAVTICAVAVLAFSWLCGLGAFVFVSPALLIMFWYYDRKQDGKYDSFPSTHMTNEKSN